LGAVASSEFVFQLCVLLVEKNGKFQKRTQDCNRIEPKRDTLRCQRFEVGPVIVKRAELNCCALGILQGNRFSTLHHVCNLSVQDILRQALAKFFCKDLLIFFMKRAVTQAPWAHVLQQSTALLPEIWCDELLGCPRSLE